MLMLGKYFEMNDQGAKFHAIMEELFKNTIISLDFFLSTNMKFWNKNYLSLRKNISDLIVGLCSNWLEIIFHT